MRLHRLNSVSLPMELSAATGVGIYLASFAAEVACEIVGLQLAEYWEFLGFERGAAWIQLIGPVGGLVTLVILLRWAVQPNGITLPASIGIANPHKVLGLVGRTAVLLGVVQIIWIGWQAVHLIDGAPPTELPAASLPGAIEVLFVKPLLEELAFRWVLLCAFRRLFGLIGAAVASSALFAGVHLGANSEERLFLFLFGCVLCAGVAASRSILPSLGCHSLHNLIVSLVD